MPYIKPGKMYHAQMVMSDLLVSNDIPLMDLSDDAVDFLYTNPVTGEREDNIRIANVNGVWVDLDSVESAQIHDHAINEFEESQASFKEE